MIYDAALVPCGSYDENETEAALREAVERTGGLDAVEPGMTVALKVNLVSPMKPEQAATVHPSVVRAVVKLVTERGAKVIIGDSPGGLYNAPYLRRTYELCGMKSAEALGAKLNDDFSHAEADYPQAVQAKHFTYTAYLDSADAIIDLCKLKTHGMMGMTNAVKNFFGVVPGTMKPEYHYKYPRLEDFADMIVDLYEYFKPCLCVCDAVFGMEGNGPTQGSPRKIGCLAVSANGHLLDSICAGLIGLDPMAVPTVAAASRRGLLGETPSAASVYGDPAAFTVPDFRTVPVRKDAGFSFVGGGAIGELIDRAGRALLTPFPKLSPQECIGCAKCASICPAKAITMKNKKPRIDRRACIHCFCCQEFCPKGAMKVGRHVVPRLLGRK